MSVRGHLLLMLQTVAEALGADLRDRLVFVGGCTTALFITDEVTIEDVRATDDVDLIVDLAGYAEWVELQDQLRRRGFMEAYDDTVICRMKLGSLKVDFMPDDPAILGFSNRWYAKCIDMAVKCQIKEGINIRRLTPELFIATKLEAYLGRGNGDLLDSRDIEDIILIMDGRQEIIEEVRRSDADIRQFIAEQFRFLLKDQDFDHLLHGNIRGPKGRVDIVRERIVILSDDGASAPV